MSDSNSPENLPQQGHQAAPGAGTAVAEQNPFTPAELSMLRREDKTAARTIVGLMLGIFTMGLIGYLLVAFWVM